MAIKTVSTGEPKISNLSTQDTSGDGAQTSSQTQVQRTVSKDVFEASSSSTGFQAALTDSKDFHSVKSERRFTQHFEQNIGLSPQEDLALKMRMSLADGVTIRPTTRPKDQGPVTAGLDDRSIDFTDEIKSMKNDFQDAYQLVKTLGSSADRMKANALNQWFHHAIKRRDFDKAGEYLQKMEALADKYEGIKW